MVQMYGFDGEKITEEEYSRLFRSEERILRRSFIVAGGQNLFISSVWIGLSWMLEVEEGQKPLIYETMVFHDGSYNDVWSHRDATREEAEKTHDWIVDALVSGRMVLPGPEFSDDEVF